LNYRFFSIRAAHEIATEAHQSRGIGRRPGQIRWDRAVVDDGHDQQREAHLAGGEENMLHGLYDRS